MLLTYLGSPQLKADFLAQIGQHEAADALIKGTYGRLDGDQHFRGCAVGCSLHSLSLLHGKSAAESADHTDQHGRYEAELGWPTWLAYLEDHLFETMPNELALTWPRRLAEAVPVGAVIDDIVLAKILRWTLAHEEFGVRHATDDAEVHWWIDTIVAAFDAEIAGTCTAEQREAAARAAWAAGAAWDAWAATSSSAAKKADAFSAALSDYVIEVLRELSPHADAMEGRGRL